MEATRLMGLRLQNMRDRKRDKGVRMCPEVKMSEVQFLEPLDENGERDDDEAIDVGSDGEEHNVAATTTTTTEAVEG